jgi:hypothetical protein
MTMCIDLCQRPCSRQNPEHMPVLSLCSCHCIVTCTLSDGCSSQTLLLRCLQVGTRLQQLPETAAAVHRAGVPRDRVPAVLCRHPAVLSRQPADVLATGRSATTGMCCHSYGVYLHAPDA